MLRFYGRKMPESSGCRVSSQSGGTLELLREAGGPSSTPFRPFLQAGLLVQSREQQYWNFIHYIRDRGNGSGDR